MLVGGNGLRVSLTEKKYLHFVLLYSIFLLLSGFNPGPASLHKHSAHIVSSPEARIIYVI